MKKIGVIGLGSIGMRHAKNLLAMGHEVLGFDNAPIANVRTADGTEIYQTNSGPIFLTPPQKILTECDGVVIATPTNTRQKVFRNLSPDIPALVEKPIGASEKDRSFIEEHLKDRLSTARIMMGNNLRFHSCVRKAKEWLAEGLIGKTLWASFCVAQYNTKYTDPVVLNWGAHEIDLALHLLGPATVTAAAGNDKIMDVCLLHEYGVPSTVHMDYVTDPERRGLTIAGWDGLIECDLVLRTIKCTPRHGMVKFDVEHDSFDENYKEEMQAFIDLIDGKVTPYAATGEDGLHALETIIEAQRMAGIP